MCWAHARWSRRPGPVPGRRSTAEAALKCSRSRSPAALQRQVPQRRCTDSGQAKGPCRPTVAAGCFRPCCCMPDLGRPQVSGFGPGLCQTPGNVAPSPNARKRHVFGPAHGLRRTPSKGPETRSSSWGRLPLAGLPMCVACGGWRADGPPRP